MRLGIALLLISLVLQTAVTGVTWSARLGRALTYGGVGLVLGWLGIRWLASLAASRSSLLWRVLAGMHALAFAYCGIALPVWAVLYLAGLAD